MPIAPEQRKLCNDNALYCYGTAYIFEKRAASIRWKIRVLTFLGIAVPASVGAIIGSFSLTTEYTKEVLTIAGLLGLTQLILSIWSLTAKWDDNLSYYLESKVTNYRLSSDWNQLSNTTIISDLEFATKLEVMKKEFETISDLDNRHDITDSEKHMGMRAGLRKFQRLCVECNKIPTSMKPTDCGVCGK